jgi:hypothetical protein
MPICENLNTLEIQEKVQKKRFWKLCKHSKNKNLMAKFINHLNYTKLYKIYIKCEN